jgi:hypothetical protein
VQVIHNVPILNLLSEETLMVRSMAITAASMLRWFCLSGSEVCPILGEADLISEEIAFVGKQRNFK